MTYNNIYILYNDEGLLLHVVVEYRAFSFHTIKYISFSIYLLLLRKRVWMLPPPLQPNDTSLTAHLNRPSLWLVFSLRSSTMVAYISHNSRRGNSSWISAPTSQHRRDSSSSVRSVRVWAGRSSRPRPHGEVFVPAEMSLSSTQSSDTSSRRRRPAEYTQGERLQLIFSLW